MPAVSAHVKRHQTDLVITVPVAFQGKYEEAEPLLIRSLAIHENAYGPDHSAVAASLNNRAGQLQCQVRAIRNGYRSSGFRRFHTRW